MSDIFDIVQFKKSKKDKTYAVKLGWATKRDDGGFWLNMDALPYGEGSIAVVPQKAKGEAFDVKREVGALRRELAEDDGVPF